MRPSAAAAPLDQTTLERFHALVKDVFVETAVAESAGGANGEAVQRRDERRAFAQDWWASKYRLERTREVRAGNGKLRRRDVDGSVLRARFPSGPSTAGRGWP